MKYRWNLLLKQHPRLKERYGKGERGRVSITETAFAKVPKAQIAEYLKDSKTARLTEQIIVVCDHELSLWNKQTDGSWRRRLKAYCGYGKNGLSENRAEGDKTTPIGSFPILYAFGNGENPGTQMKWREITPYSYWSEEQDTYNTWVESKTKISGEHLAECYKFSYEMAIGFNMDPVVYKKGSAIFLHCKSMDHWHTDGCVSVKPLVMKKLLRYCKDGAYIIIVKNDTAIKKY